MTEQRHPDARPPHTLHRPVLASALMAAVATAFVLGLTGLPTEGAPLPAIARHAMQIALPKWGQQEVVSEIVYGSRGFDTFGETFLLLAAVLSVVVLSRGREPRAEYLGEATAGRREQAEIDPQDQADQGETEARSAERAEEAGTESAEGEETSGGPPPAADPDSIGLGTRAPERAAAMTVVVRGAARTSAVFLFVAGIYLAAWGFTPGGGFPGGAVLTGVALLLYGALGHQRINRLVRPNLLEPLELAGAIGIIVVGVLGLARAGSMFANFLRLAEPGSILAGGSEQLYSGAELVEVATGLTIAIFSLLGIGHDWAPDEQEPDA
ncbi:MAG TPA: MnhB domain-containing protein [Jatrophihabitans sp.]|nr:MnhB domain-containing protein [Jatrophihabitans sp.]